MIVVLHSWPCHSCIWFMSWWLASAVTIVASCYHRISQGHQTLPPPGPFHGSTFRANRGDRAARWKIRAWWDFLLGVNVNVCDNMYVYVKCVLVCVYIILCPKWCNLTDERINCHQILSYSMTHTDLTQTSVLWNSKHLRSQPQVHTSIATGGVFSK